MYRVVTRNVAVFLSRCHSLSHSLIRHFPSSFHQFPLASFDCTMVSSSALVCVSLWKSLVTWVWNMERFPSSVLLMGKSMSSYKSVKGCNVYLIQPTCPPANENLMELKIMIDACWRASAKNITAVIPYFGYARAHRKATKLVANLITKAGADRVLACDLHSGQSMGYFDIPVDHVHCQVTNQIGDVKGKFAVMVDDMIDTAGKNDGCISFILLFSSLISVGDDDSRETDEAEKELEHALLQNTMDKEMNELNKRLEQKESAMKLIGVDTEVLKQHYGKKIVELEEEKRKVQEERDRLWHEVENLATNSDGLAHKTQDVRGQKLKALEDRLIYSISRLRRPVQLQHKIKQEAEQFQQWKASREKELLQVGFA
ncbi:hypothetical protein VNO80_21494 [Phaseolus coccineus]|uniref:ribose-phosphate diphosphokinase n=1 Tax=Phaseolus coccineus TaxID=3886 RepID=A0AAN9QR01_PHACN